jgi:hypothetical protein
MGQSASSKTSALLTGERQMLLCSFSCFQLLSGFLVTVVGYLVLSRLQFSNDGSSSIAAPGVWY